MANIKENLLVKGVYEKKQFDFRRFPKPNE